MSLFVYCLPTYSILVIFRKPKAHSCCVTEQTLPLLPNLELIERRFAFTKLFCLLCFRLILQALCIKVLRIPPPHFHFAEHTPISFLLFFFSFTYQDLSTNMNISIDPMGTDPMDTEANMPFALPLHQVAASRMGSGTLTAAEAEERYQCALELEKHIKLSNKKFHLRLDHVAAILLADLQEIREGGRLWAGPPCGVAPYLMERRLNAISPLCRHCKNTTLTLAL